MCLASVIECGDLKAHPAAARINASSSPSAAGAQVRAADCRPQLGTGSRTCHLSRPSAYCSRGLRRISLTVKVGTRGRKRSADREASRTHQQQTLGCVCGTKEELALLAWGPEAWGPDCVVAGEKGEEAPLAPCPWEGQQVRSSVGCWALGEDPGDKGSCLEEVAFEREQIHQELTSQARCKPSDGH